MSELHLVKKVPLGAEANGSDVHTTVLVTNITESTLDAGEDVFLDFSAFGGGEAKVKLESPLGPQETADFTFPSGGPSQSWRRPVLAWYQEPVRLSPQRLAWWMRALSADDLRRDPRDVDPVVRGT